MHIDIKSDVKFVTRIREPCNGKIRSIKAVLESSHIRYLMMKSLVKLRVRRRNKCDGGLRLVREKFCQTMERNSKDASDSNIILRIRGIKSS